MQYIIVPGKPVPKARARTVFHDRKVISYTPPKTREFEKKVRACAAHAGLKQYTGDLATVMVFHLNSPADVDNLIKTVHDALNGIAYGDDRQIKATAAERRPCEPGQERTEVAILDLAKWEQIADIDRVMSAAKTG